MNKALEYLKDNSYDMIREKGNGYTGIKWAVYPDTKKICGTKSKVFVSVDSRGELQIKSE